MKEGKKKQIKAQISERVLETSLLAPHLFEPGSAYNSEGLSDSKRASRKGRNKEKTADETEETLSLSIGIGGISSDTDDSFSARSLIWGTEGTHRMKMNPVQNSTSPHFNMNLKEKSNPQKSQLQALPSVQLGINCEQITHVQFSAQKMKVTGFG